MPGDKLPQLMIVALQMIIPLAYDPGSPTPRAMVADNDYALGRIVEAFSKSRFWENTVIFVVEDDSQSGWDHVSAYRTVALVISPYSRLKKDSPYLLYATFYGQDYRADLGLPPMNIQDAIANPMTDCFGTVADKTPYLPVPNNIPLDEMNPQILSLKGKARYFAEKSMLPEYDGVDSGDDDLLNRILWYAAKGDTPYPGKFSGAEMTKMNN